MTTDPTQEEDFKIIKMAAASPDSLPSEATLSRIRQKARVTQKNSFREFFRFPQLAGALALLALIIGVNFLKKNPSAPSPPAKSSFMTEPNSLPQAPVINADYSTAPPRTAVVSPLGDPLFSLAQRLEEEERWEEAARVYRVLSERNMDPALQAKFLQRAAVCLEKAGHQINQ